MNPARHRISRRPLLAGLGSVAGAAVLLRPLIAEAEGIVPQRFLYIHYPCGTVSGLPGEGQGATWYWYPPSGSGPSYTPSPLLNLFSPVMASVLPLDGIDLGDVEQMVDGSKHSQGIMFMGSGWMPVAPDCCPVSSQFDPPNAMNLTVRKGTKTIDQHLLDVVPALSAPLFAGDAGPQFRSIQLAGTAKSMQNTGEASLKVLSYAGYEQPLWPEGRSQQAFNNVFGSAMGLPPSVVARRQAQKKSMLDLVIKDMMRLRSAVPSSQYPKLDAHLDALRALELRVAPPVSPDAGVGKPVVQPTLVSEPTTGHNGATADEARHGALIQNMLEIIRCAFLSDLTRVASITYADGNNPLRPIAFCPNPGFSNNADGHGVSSSGVSADVIEAKGEMAAFYTRATAQALTNMAQSPEGSGALLDNVFGLYFTECRESDTHERRRDPVMLFGGKFLKLNTGQFMIVQPRAYANDIWASALTAWGVPTTTYGDPQYGTGPIPGLFGP